MKIGCWTAAEWNYITWKQGTHKSACKCEGLRLFTMIKGIFLFFILVFLSLLSFTKPTELLNPRFIFTLCICYNVKALVRYLAALILKLSFSIIRTFPSRDLHVNDLFSFFGHSFMNISKPLSIFSLQAAPALVTHYSYTTWKVVCTNML